jgi:hypothetical protein
VEEQITGRVATWKRDFCKKHSDVTVGNQVTSIRNNKGTDYYIVGYLTELSVVINYHLTDWQPETGTMQSATIVDVPHLLRVLSAQ